MDLIFSWIFPLGILWGAIFSVFTMLQSIKASGWKHTTGRVISSDVEEIFYDDLEGGSGSEDKVIVRYKYKVQGQQYESGRIVFGYESGNLRKKFVAASEVRVFYDPLKPENSVLLTGIQGFHIGNIIAVVICFAIWLYVESNSLL